MGAVIDAGRVFLSAEVSVPDALILSVLGFAMVFVVLVILILVIKVISGATQKIGTNNSAEAAIGVILPASQASAPAVGSSGEVNLHSVSDKTAALLMAIVADEMKTPLNELRFISIKELGDTK